MINKIHSRHLPSLSLSLPSSLPDSSFSLTLWQEGRDSSSQMLKWSVNNIPQSVVKESLNHTTSDRCSEGLADWKYTYQLNLAFGEEIKSLKKKEKIMRSGKRCDAF